MDDVQKETSDDSNVIATKSGMRVSDIKLDVKSLGVAVAASTLRQTSVDSDQTLLVITNEAAALLAKHSNMEKEFIYELFLQMLALEVGFPTLYDVYSSAMWASSPTYVGVMQTSKGNWQDTRSKMSFLNRDVASAPLLEQLIGVFGYLLRAKSATKQRVKVNGVEMRIGAGDLPLVAGAVYAIHNQGYNGAVSFLLKAQPLIGRQSAVAKRVLSSAKVDVVKSFKNQV